MSKGLKHILVLAGIAALLAGIAALAWGFYAETQIGMVANSFMGQMSMMSGQISRQDLARTLANAKTAMTVGAILALAGLISLLVGALWKTSPLAPPADGTAP